MIAQLRTGFRQKLFRLKTCPQGVLQAQQEKSGFFYFYHFHSSLELLTLLQPVSLANGHLSRLFHKLDLYEKIPTMKNG